MKTPLALDVLQRWLMAAITHPAGVEAGLASPSAQAEFHVDPDQLATIIPESRQQSAAQRLAVYSQAYFARLLEVLRELFPCLRSAVGDELFDMFAVEFLQSHPPRSYTLHQLADDFPVFLERTRPAGDDWGGFVVELTRLEQAIDQIFDGPGPEELQEASGNEQAFPSGEIRLALVPGFRLLAFAFPVSAYYTAWKAGQQVAWPQPLAQFIALFRRDYIVRRYELSRAQYDLLAQVAGGQPLEEALAAIATSEADLEALAGQVREWFIFWGRERFFAPGARIASALTH